MLGRPISTCNPADTSAPMTGSFLTSGSSNPSNPASSGICGISPDLGAVTSLGRTCGIRWSELLFLALFLHLLKTGGRAAVMAVEEYERLKVFEVGHVDSGPSTSGTDE
jgi:hypothetical protein